MTQNNINNLSDLHAFYSELPEGTTSDINSPDLEAGNFEEATFITPNTTYHIRYTGPVSAAFERTAKEQDFQAAYPNGFDRLSDEIDALKRYGLYCGSCGHGNRCEHGVPASRY